MIRERVRWEVLPMRGVFGWKVTRAGELQRMVLFKRNAIALAVDGCRYEWEAWDVLSELVIKSRDGKIQDTRTYGLDPRDIRG